MLCHKTTTTTPPHKCTEMNFKFLPRTRFDIISIENRLVASAFTYPARTMSFDIYTYTTHRSMMGRTIAARSFPTLTRVSHKRARAYSRAHTHSHHESQQQHECHRTKGIYQFSAGPLICLFVRRGSLDNSLTGLSNQASRCSDTEHRINPWR